MAGWTKAHIGAWLLVGAFIGSSDAPAMAATPDGVFALEDSGRMPCPDFLEAVRSKSEVLHRAIGFVEGYVSAANRYEANTFDLAPWHTPQAFSLILEKHCQKQPSDNLGMAAQRLVVALQPLRLAAPSKLIEVGSGTTRTFLYEAILKRAQSQLTRRGFYNGAAIGQFDDATKRAFAAFQTSTKLEPTGIPDPGTLWMLLNP